MPNELRTVQMETRPGLSPIGNRDQVLKTLGTTSARLRPGAAMAIMGEPGTDLHRLAGDIIRGIGDSTVIVWVDLANLSDAVSLASDEADATIEGGAWDRALQATLQASFDQALKDEGHPTGAAGETALHGGGPEQTTVLESLLRFGRLARRLHYWPVIVLESLHCLPWTVSERLQRSLRVALDNQDRQQILRIVLTGNSDFLSGEAIGEGDRFHTSPLYERTTRYVVVPFTKDDLWELTPLPGGLPDRLLDILIRVTGGHVGYLELFMKAIQTDPSLGHRLLMTFSDNKKVPDWFWEWLSRSEHIAKPGRALVLEGLTTLLSNAKGRSRTILQAMDALVAGKALEETSAEALLPLELAGLVELEQQGKRYLYRWANQLIHPLLMDTLPPGQHLRHRLEMLAQNNSHPVTTADQIQPVPRTTVRTTGTRRHVTTTMETTPVSSGPRLGVKLPLHLPSALNELVNDRGPTSARVLIELVRDVVSATQQARSKGTNQILTLSQLKIEWRSSDEQGGASPSLVSGPELSAQLAGGEIRGRWQVELLEESVGEAHQLEALALFVPPDRTPALLHARATGQAFVPAPKDDAYAIGILIGLLLTRETSSQLMLGRLEDRLTGAVTLGVGPLIRLVGHCLDPSPTGRPSLDQIGSRLQFVLADPFSKSRRILRHLMIWSLAILVIVALYDFALDTRVDNPNWLYTGIKLVGAAGTAAFYLIAWLWLGRTDRAQIHLELWKFLRQRMNRVRWLAIPTAIALSLSIVFGYRVFYSWGVQLTLPAGHRLEEVKTRVGDVPYCESVYKFAAPPESASLRLALDRDRAYVFVLLHDNEQGTVQRLEFFWPPEEVKEQRSRKWGETVYVYALKPPPSGQACLPRPPSPTGTETPPVLPDKSPPEPVSSRPEDGMEPDAHEPGVVGEAFGPGLESPGDGPDEPTGPHVPAGENTPSPSSPDVP